MKRKSNRSAKVTAWRSSVGNRFRAWLAPQSRQPRRRRNGLPAGIDPKLPLPVIAAGDLARPIGDLPDGEPIDGLLKYAAYQSGFEVSLGPLSGVIPTPTGRESITLYVDGTSLALTINLEEQPDGTLLPDPVVFSVPANFAGTNPYEYFVTLMWYRVNYGTGASDDSLKVNIGIDTTKPADGGAFLGQLVFPADIVRDGITVDSFAGRDYIEAEVPGYRGEKAADWARQYIATTLDTDPTHYAVIPWDDVPSRVVVRFYRAFIEMLGDGRHAFQVDVFPREENASSLSEPVYLEVRLDDAIDDLAAPGVPAFDDDTGTKLVTELDARGNLVVTVPENPLITEDDFVQILWADETSTLVKIDDPENIQVVVSYAVILAAWLAGNPEGADAIISIAVRYRIFGPDDNLRGTSETHTVEVNLHVAGGIVDPDPGTEPNENLDVLTLESASGKLNLIDLADRGEDATARVPYLSLADDADGDPLPAWTTGDAISIRDPDGNELASHTVEAIDLDPASGYLEVTVPWDELEPLPGGVVKLAWWVETTLTDGTINTNKAPSTAITIQTTDALPGKGTLSEVVLPEMGRNAAGWVDLPDIENGVVIAFPMPVENFDPDTDTITVSIPMYLVGHSGTEAPVLGFGDAIGQNRFELPPPHTMHPADAGDVPEPPGGGEPTRPPVLTPYVLFRLMPERFPTLHGTEWYHSHIKWSITNAVGTGSSPAVGLFVRFDVRGSALPSRAMPSRSGSVHEAAFDDDGTHRFAIKHVERFMR
ncbi:hypothetical protein [Luteibacter aegosomatissinici]|uniref:hypothetical protein n=1 Tax=Luteibacter aegosomatissinici TaxID=2911539 RepID=UPI001FFBC48C|nr:hypothetical protein [Luteibacter aegosomatissinici]UPG96434.1 hypothetical protein L2Y97_10075 [Luteibacter aegosomatissinici]